MEIKLRYVVPIRKRGGRKGDRTLWYWHRKGFPLRRLPDDETSPAFVALVHRLNDEADGEIRAAAQASAEAGSFKALVEKYLDSPDVTGLAARTQANYAYFLHRIAARVGHLPIEEVDRSFVYELRDSLRETPSTANEMVSTLRGFLTWLVDRRVIAENPAAKPKRITVRRRRAVWTPAAEAAFLARADETMRLAFLLGAYTAQRLGDICAMTWGQYDGARIRLRQQKTDELVEVPCHKVLRAALDAAPRRSLMILTTSTGRPFRPSNFNLLWVPIAMAAGVHGKLQFRDLRRTAMVRLAEAGANAIQISAVSGHDIDSTQRILETYVPRNLAMAEAAILKWEERASGTKV